MIYCKNYVTNEEKDSFRLNTILIHVLWSSFNFGIFIDLFKKTFIIYIKINVTISISRALHHHSQSQAQNSVISRDVEIT